MALHSSVRPFTLSKLSTTIRSVEFWFSSGYLTLFLVAFGVRVLYLNLVSQNLDAQLCWNLFPDTLHYRNVASWFASGNPEFESSLLLVGPGYGFILFALEFIFGSNVWGFLTIGTIISSLSCVLISALCGRINLEKRVGLLAGYIHALSISAISASCTILTETWFIFFTLLTLITFLNALRSKTFASYVIFASIAFCAAMVRSVGQFYPLALLGVVVIFAIFQRITHQPRISLVKPLFGTLLALALISSWPLRNYITHDVFTISETGTRAAKRYWLAAALSGSHDESEIIRRRNLWDEQMYQRFDTKYPSLSQRHSFDISVIRDTVMKYPAKMAGAYLSNVWINMTKDSRLQYIQTPQLLPLWQLYTKKIASGLGAPLFWLSLLGGLLLFIRGNSFAAILLTVSYFYFGLITGATFWQGSRIFLPGELAWAPLVSVAIFWSIEKTRNLIAERR